MPQLLDSLLCGNKNAFHAYDDRLVIVMDGIEDLIFKETVINIYIAEPHTSLYEEPTVVIDAAAPGGEMRYELPDTFFEHKLSLFVHDLITSHWPFLNTAKRMTPTRSWLNTASAISTILDKRDLSTFCGLIPAGDNVDIQREVLEMNWGINTEQIARIMVNSLLKCRANEKYLQLINTSFDNSDRIALARKIHEEFGDKGIKAWDYARAIFLAGSVYIAGYFSLEEASEAALEAGLLMQKTFDSWEDMNRNYLLGFDFWFFDAGEDRKVMGEHKRKIYERLLAAENSPYKTIAWDLPLSKDW